MVPFAALRAYPEPAAGNDRVLCCAACTKTVPIPDRGPCPDPRQAPVARAPVHAPDGCRARLPSPPCAPQPVTARVTLPPAAMSRPLPRPLPGSANAEGPAGTIDVGAQDAVEGAALKVRRPAVRTFWCDGWAIGATNGRIGINAFHTVVGGKEAGEKSGRTLTVTGMSPPLARTSKRSTDPPPASRERRGRLGPEPGPAPTVSPQPLVGKGLGSCLPNLILSVLGRSASRCPLAGWRGPRRLQPVRPAVTVRFEGATQTTLCPPDPGDDY